MRQYWTSEELIEDWSLLPDEMLLLRNKSDNTRLGFAIGLKFFQRYHRFPQDRDNIPNTIANHLATQIGVKTCHVSSQYVISKRHRKVIRHFLGFRLPSEADSLELKVWIVNTIAQAGYSDTKTRELAYQHLYERSIEPFASDQMNRYVNAALHQFEEALFDTIATTLPIETKETIDRILSPATNGKQSDETMTIPLPVSALKLNDLKQPPGKASLNCVLIEATKLKLIQHLQLPSAVFSAVAQKILKKYGDRVIGESPSELKAYKPNKKYALVALFCYLRQQEITDSLANLLIQITHKIKTKAEQKIITAFSGDILKVKGKYTLLYKIATLSLANPNGIIREVIYPIIGEQVLQDIVKELGSGGSDYRNQVYTVIRSSYTHHYRQMLPALLDTLAFHTNTEENNALLDGIKMLRKYSNSPLINYPDQEAVPTDKIIPELWQDMVIEKKEDGSCTINRVNYEIAILNTLRERIRCKEIWLTHAYHYRNPDEDLPADFEKNRQKYYAILNKPLDKHQFTTELKDQMEQALTLLNENIPSNKKVNIQQRKQKKKKHWISVSPLKPQPDPHNIDRLKGDVLKQWPATSLLDILKETAFRVGFTACFKSTASKEILDKKTIQERLLLCLFGVATNIGIKRIRAGNRRVSYNDLRYIYRRFINAVSLREAIAKIVNATFQARDPCLWGEATTTCASDAKKFSAWEQNLLTEWHIRYRGAGIMVYWHVDKNSTCIYSQLKSCSSSEVASMIEGVLRHCTSMDVKRNYTDSRGQSIIGFAFSHLLNFDLLPRLKNIGPQKLHLSAPAHKDKYDCLKPILTRAINWDLIHAQYDLIIKYATALYLGTADSEVILRRFTRDNAKHPVYKALMELGKAVKTIFLCKYLCSEALRQEIHAGLNVVERWNSINGFISYARKGVISTNRTVDQEIALLCLHLLQIAMVYINTLMIQQILKQASYRDQLTTEDKRALSPLIYLHINPYGLFNLDLTTRLPLEG